MCYHTKLTKDAVKVENRFKAKFAEPDTFQPAIEFNGFNYPATPIIRFDDKKTILMYEWGLIGDQYTSDKIAQEMRRGCLNARVEDLEETKTYKDKIGNRCLIPMDGMYEWQWINPEAKTSKKKRFLVTKPKDELFACAGLFNEWKNPKTGIITYCYAIVTTEGNKLMKEIHNHGERMLIVLNPDEEAAWLDPKNHHLEFVNRDHIELVAKFDPIKKPPKEGETLSIF